MRKRKIYWTLFIAAFAWFTSCSDDSNGAGGFNPSQPIEITGFYPDSGGIATPMIIEGNNFGTDTTNMKVYFEDVDGIRHPAGLVSTNGSRIYVFVPKGLTYKKEMNILVERRTLDGQEYIGKAEDQFMYKTQTSVSTVVGLASPDNNQASIGGDLATCKLSGPHYLCLDDENNIFISERTGLALEMPNSNQPSLTCLNDKGVRVEGNIVMASLKTNTVLVLKYDAGDVINAPAYSDEEENQGVYIPCDNRMNYFELPKLLQYIPRSRTVIKGETTGDIDSNNWKHCFVVNKIDHMIYTVMWKGQLVRVNPRNRTAEILLKKVSNTLMGDFGGSSKEGSDTYITFSPIKGEENLLYMCFANYNQIWRVDVSKITPEQKDTYHGEAYAGKAITEGVQAGKGWEDGLLKNAMFKYPRQICFTEDGKLYIADSANSCIRVIDTTMPKDKATVTTPIGLPGVNGYTDGGPEIAKFHSPCGVAVNADGTIVYVADTQNKVIRKLSIE